MMTAEEAVGAANAIGAQIVVPMHYGAGIGSADDGARFAKDYAGQVVIMTVNGDFSPRMSAFAESSRVFTNFDLYS